MKMSGRSQDANVGARRRVMQHQHDDESGSHGVERIGDSSPPEKTGGIRFAEEVTARLPASHTTLREAQLLHETSQGMYRGLNLVLCGSNRGTDLRGEVDLCRVEHLFSHG